MARAALSYDERAFSTVLETDRQRTDARSIEVDASEEYAARVLTVYPDAATAEMAVAEIRAAASLWPHRGGAGADGDALVRRRGGVRRHPGLVLWGAEHSVETGEPTGVGRSVSLLTRVGNALLPLTTLSDESGGAPLDLDEPPVAALRSATAELADQMCVFAPDPCS